MTKLLNTLLLLLLVIIINYPDLSTSDSVYEQVCGTNKHCNGWEFFGAIPVRYKTGCCVNQRCVFKGPNESKYCANSKVETKEEFDYICDCFPLNTCVYGDKYDEVKELCITFVDTSTDHVRINKIRWWLEKLR